MLITTSGTSKAISPIHGSQTPSTPIWAKYSALRRSYLAPEYRRDTALHNVIATVHVEAECDRCRQIEETEWLTRIAMAHGMPNAIVAHAWIDEPNGEGIIVRQKAFPLVRGIRAKPIISKGPGHSVLPRSMQHPKWRNDLSLLEKHDLSWDLRVTWWHLEEAAEVVHEPLAGGAQSMAPGHGGVSGIAKRRPL
jgi:predicted TIM-barrel fold metal-dependent hydrolase